MGAIPMQMRPGADLMIEMVDNEVVFLITLLAFLLTYITVF